MASNNNKLFSKNKDLYNTRIVDYNESISQKGLDILTREALENEDIVQFLERIDTYSGLFSTQQIFNLDWSKFENHTFFDSAIAKVNYVFDKLLNDFPYDSSYLEYNQFIKKLDGYSSYILNEKFPKSLNSIYLGQNYVEVIDKPGVVLKEKTANKGFLNPKNKSFNFDFWINLDNTTSSDNRIIAQKLDTSNNVGITLYLNNDTEKTLNLLITNSKNEYVKSNIDIDHFINTQRYTFDSTNQTGYIHVSVIIQSSSNQNAKKEVKFYINGKNIKEDTQGSITSDFIETETSQFNDAEFLIGNGFNHIVTNNTALNVTAQPLNGLIDEFRFFHKTRTLKIINDESNKPIFSQDGLALYLKFNEPSGDYSNNFLTLDSSGNKLHGQIKDSLTQTILGSSDVSNLRIYKPAPIVREADLSFPVLFPNFSQIKTLQQDLLEIADEYDSINPNIIFNLFPKHYFIEGSDAEGNSNIFANNSSFSERENLGIDQPATQEFVNILLIWARFFDELKCYIDNLSEIINTDYDDLNSKTPFGVVMPLATKLLGFEFKNIFPSPTKDKLDGYNFSHSDIHNELGIRKLQNEIWKRILINSQDFLRSKGTVNSIKSLFNAAGLEADRFIDIKEFNGKNKLNFSETNRIFMQNIKFVDFGDNSMFFEENTLTDEIPDHKLRLTSDFIFDQFNTNPSTSGSFTYEGYYRFNDIKKNIYSLTQSLCIINKENEALTLSEGIEVYEPIVSLTFNRSTQDKEYGTLKLEIQPTEDSLDYQKIELENLNLINGEMWHISFGRKNISSNNKWENFLYVKPAGNKKYEPHIISKKEQELIGLSTDNFDADTNTFFSVGLRFFNPAVQGLGSSTPSLFEGEISNIRFYNTNLTLEELLQRSNDITYVGFKDALNKRKLVLNYDFTEEFTESDVKVNNITSANYFSINDKSIFNVGKQAWTRLSDIDAQNQANKFTDNIRLSGSLVTRASQENLLSCIKRRNVLILKNDARFDEVFSSEKIKINSFQDENLANINNGILSPDFSLNPDMTQFNEARLSIEHSNVKYLNQDISKMIGSFEFLSKAYGLSSNIYDTDYVDIKAARELYFEKMIKEIDFKPMQQVFKYFDNILSDLIEDSIPSKINYMGFNYVYESHALERHKYEYKMSECRIPIEDEGHEFSRPVINSPRTTQSINRRLYKQYTSEGES